MAMLLTIILPVFAVILMGRMAVLFERIDHAAVRGMSDLVFYIAMPCLLFDALVRAEDLRVADSAAVFLAMSLAVYALGMALAMALLRLPFAPAAVTGLNAAFGNAVMMGIPIVVASFGADALPPLLGIITIHSAIILPLATILIEFGAAGSGKAMQVLQVTGAGLVRNPVIMTMVLAFLWRALRLPLPEVAHNFFRLIGAAGPPLALFCLGASLPPLLAGVGAIREVILACTLRLAVAPALMLGAGWWFGFTDTAYKVAVLISGMPTGANAFLLARRTETAMEASAATVVMATILSVFSLSVLLAVLTVP